MTDPSKKLNKALSGLGNRTGERKPPRKLSKTEIRKRKREGRYHNGARALTTKIIARLKPGRYRDGLWSGFGLYLQVVKTKSGKISRSWLLRYQHAERERWMGLGPQSVFSLAEARKRAQAARQQLVDGIDPLAARQQAKAAARAAAAKGITFQRAAGQYYELHAGEWGNAGHRRQFPDSMQRYVFPIIGGLDVAAIDTPAVMRVLQPIWLTRTTTASRLRNRIEAVLDWAVVAGHRDAGTNPARWKNHLDHLLAKPGKIAPVVHHPAVDHKEIAAFMAALRKLEGTAERGLEFLILCAARSNEAIGATWSEIDFAEGSWTVPGSRMKSGREHKVPLSPAALDLLKALPREDGNPHVFIGSAPGRPISRTSFARVMKRLERPETVHGFRASFRTWAGECTNFPREIAEVALAHAVGDETERAYQRGDLFTKRRKLMEAWARYCATPARAKGDVVPMRGSGVLR